MNNNEIKFRYFHDKLNKFIYSDDMDFENVNQRLGAFFSKSYSEARIGTIQQFTGLKDIVGKDIYEGDVLRRKWVRLLGGLSYKDETDVKIVEWNNNTGFNFITQESIIGWKWKIIGNIYENPELKTLPKSFSSETIYPDIKAIKNLNVN